MPGDGGLNARVIGYARVSTSGQDLAAQRDGLAALGVDDDNVHVDHGLSGTTRARPGLREALAACRAGDVLVVTKLDRLARSLRDATDIADELTKKGVALNLGGAVYDPTDPVGRLLFNVLGMVAEFEADLIRARTREGMAIAKAAGKLRGAVSTVARAGYGRTRWSTAISTPLATMKAAGRTAVPFFAGTGSAPLGTVGGRRRTTPARARRTATSCPMARAMGAGGSARTMRCQPARTGAPRRRRMTPVTSNVIHRRSSSSRSSTKLASLCPVDLVAIMDAAVRAIRMSPHLAARPPVTTAPCMSSD